MIHAPKPPKRNNNDPLETALVLLSVFLLGMVSGYPVVQALKELHVHFANHTWTLW